MNENTMNNAVTMRPQSGASLGRIDQYELIRELGGGGFGCVYLAKDTVAGIEVAVKGLPPLVRLNKEELENVRKNFALVSRLHHPNIAAALTLHPVTNAFYNDKTDAEKLRVFNGDTLVVMQYAPGVTLSQWRKQFPDGKVPLDKALEITRQIASALDYAHKEKILHRDIKPANIMIETAGDGTITARVLDFGLAAEIRSSMSRVSREVTDTSGTRPYMAPEQWIGEDQGKETDQYALAVLFHELIHGKVPFASVFDTGDPVLMMNVIGMKAPTLSNDFTKSARAALAKALAKKREERFSSCTEFVDALVGRGLRPRRGRWGLVAGVALLVAAIAGGAFWLGQSTGNDNRESPAGRTVEQEQERDTPKSVSVATTTSSARRATRYKTGDEKTITLPGGVKMEMIYVGPGEFMMGSPTTEEGRDDDDETQHRVRLTKGYWLGKYPVTQRQWNALVAGNDITFEGGNPVAYFSSQGRGSEIVAGIDTSDFPMEGISWNDCNKLVKVLNANEKSSRRWMIPTEAQWEFAARGGTRSKGYKYSGGNNLDVLGWYYKNSGVDRLSDAEWEYNKLKSNKCRPHSVYEKDAGNELGIVGMSGNVLEWCQDWYDKDYYSSSPTADPTGPASGVVRVLRGGCWRNRARGCRSAFRNRVGPGNRNFNYGFRLSCSALP